MCGRYTLFVDREDLEERFDARFADAFEPTYNAAPGQRLPVVTNDDPETVRRLEWGLLPSWADDDSSGIINARAETVDEKPSFRGAYERRRCLVLADGFYEWNETGDRNQPYRVAFEDDRPFAMAGLWERWEPETTQVGLGAFGDGGNDTGRDDDGGGNNDSSSGNGANGGNGTGGGNGSSGVDAGGSERGLKPGVRETFAICTTEPNDLVADLHDRMAVVLAPEDERRWLSGDNPRDLLAPHPADEMRADPVSTAVNNPANDDPSLIEPVEV